MTAKHPIGIPPAEDLRQAGDRRAYRQIRRRRLADLAILVSLCVTFLLARLLDIQLVDGPRLAVRAFQQRTDAMALELPRGAILDRHLAPLNSPVYRWLAGAYLPHISDSEEVADRLGDILSVPGTALLERLRSGSGFVILAEGLSQSEADAVTRLQIPGLFVTQRELRYGPAAVAPHVVGHLIAPDNRGVGGLERSFDRWLAGSGPRTLVAFRDARNQPVPGQTLHTIAGSGGAHDLVTTLDAGRQRRVEAILSDSEHPAAVVVLDARNADILVLASHPSFHQARVSNHLHADDAPLWNRAITHHTPGSVFKLVTAAAALEYGMVTDRERFVCQGFVVVGDHRMASQCPALQPWATGSEPEISWKEAMAASTNEVFVELGLRTGAANLIAMARSLGFGQPTGLPLVEETSGYLPGPDRLPLTGELAMLSIGQGPVTVTPLQVAQMMAAIVNGGWMQRPRLVEQIRSSDGEIAEAFPAQDPVRVLSPDTARHLREAMIATVKTGTGQAADVAVYGAAGKTGSAETHDSQGRPTVDAWFAGYTPAILPRYVIVVWVENGGSGPRVAAPLFNLVAEAVMPPR
ncbi:MAG: penicillin-binding transpeptidase domain-containing protein [Thermaerobacterales bacterium]